MMPIDIINFGSINIDHIYKVSHFVQPGETLASESLNIVLGGKGANQSVAVARAGGRVAHVGNIGAEDKWAIGELSASGVNISAIESLPAASGHAIIQVDDEGENSILLHGGVNQQCSIEQIENALKAHPSARVLLLQNECNLVEEAMRAGLRQGLSIVYNPAPMSAATLQLPLELVDTLVINQGEGQALSGEQDPQKIIDALFARYGNTTIVLTLGAQGAIMKSGDVHRVDATKANVVDTTAAGDTFVGYFAAGLVEQLSPLDNLQRACKAAALAVGKLGAIPSIPFLAELKNFDDT